jgi:hypothetical protein
MNFSPLQAVRLFVLSIPIYFLAGCSGGDGGPAAVNAQSPNIEQQILDKLNVLESKVDGLNLLGVTQNWDKALTGTARYAILAAFNNAAVRDNNTGLVWERTPVSTTDTWQGATLQCIQKTVGGTTGWRLPSVAELNSVRDPLLPGPYIPPGVFTGVQQANYWSSTTSSAASTDAWFVNFGCCSLGTEPKSTMEFVWCVRGPTQEHLS